MDERALSLDQARVEIAASALAPPLVTYVGDGQWQLEADYTYRDGDTAITVPKGFRFDLSSVPRAFWSVIAPFELSVVGPLLHDFLYRYGGKPPAGAVVPPRTFTRAETDRLFRAIMEAEGVPAWRRTLAYLAVRTFGSGAWRD